MTKNKKGITLIEIILYIGLLSIFLFVLIDIFMGGLNLQFESQATSSVQTDGQYILTRLMYDIKNADSVTTPANLGEESQTLVLVASGVTYSYTLDQGALNLTKSGETLALNSLETNVTSIGFTRLGNVSGKPTVKIDFTIDAKTARPGGNFESRTYQTTLGLR